MSLRTLCQSLVISSTVSLLGCATILGSPTQTIPIASTPSEAKVSITDETGQEVFVGATPTTVTLQKSTGHYWGKKNFQVTITKPGYNPQTVAITASANGWYMFGNIVFGGLIGWFIIDPFNGDMYTLSPDNISTSFGPGPGHANNGSITIVLLEDVPATLREKMIKLN